MQGIDKIQWTFVPQGNMRNLFYCWHSNQEADGEFLVPV